MNLLQDASGWGFYVFCGRPAAGGVVDAVFDHVFNVGPWRRCEIWMHNTAISYFEYVAHPGRETWRLHFHSRVTHLAEAGLL